MGTILVSALIASCRITLLDPTPGVTWLDADFIDFLNQAQRRTCQLKHEAYPVRASVSLVAGTRQTLPAGAVGLMDVYENTVSKRGTTQVSRAMLDASGSWRAATQEVNVREWMTDPRDPLVFDVYPPNTGAGAVVALYGALPPVLTAVGDAIGLADHFETVLKYFVLGEAYAANTLRQDLTKATFYKTQAEQLLGIGSQSQVAVAPKANAPGGG